MQQHRPNPAWSKSILACVLALLCVSGIGWFNSGCDRGTELKTGGRGDKPQATTIPFSLAIVPQTSFGGQLGASIEMALKSRYKPRKFYVVLTNVSKGTQSVWDYWNSRGYQTISFAFVTGDGKEFVVSKRQQGFTRNFPSVFLIDPGEHQVYAIRLDDEWEAHPLLPKSDEMPITLKAIYEVSPTPEAAQYKIWTGRIESHSYNLSLRRW